MRMQEKDTTGQRVQVSPQICVMWRLACFGYPGSLPRCEEQVFHIFSLLLISHSPYLQLRLCHCNCHLSLKSAFPICTLSSTHRRTLSFQTYFFKRTPRMNQYLPCYIPSSIRLPAPNFGELYLLADLFGESFPLIETCLYLLASASSCSRGNISFPDAACCFKQLDELP